MPPPRHADKRFLERHGNKWRVVGNVPRDLQEVMGKTKLKQSLDTDSLEVANRLKWSVLEALQAQINRHRSPEDITAEALKLATLRRRIQDAGENEWHIDDEIVRRAEDIAGKPVGVDVRRQHLWHRFEVVI